MRRRSTATRSIVLVAASMIGVGLGTPAGAQSESSFPAFGIGGNVGFQKLSSSSGLFEVGFEMPVYLNESFSVGPWLQVGTSQDVVNVIFTANGRWHFQFLERTRFNKVQPFLQGGLGLIHTRVDGAKANDFVMNMGFGAEAPVTDHIWVGSDVMFHPILTRDLGANWTFSWQFLTVRYRF